MIPDACQYYFQGSIVWYYGRWYYSDIQMLNIGLTSRLAKSVYCSANCTLIWIYVKDAVLEYK